MGCVSGLLLEIGDAKTFACLILKMAGSEDDGEYRVELGDDFSLQCEAGFSIPYEGGHMLSFPEMNEALIDVVGIPYPEYEQLFPEHVAKYERKF